MMKSAAKLSRSNTEEFRKVRLAPDLTQAQRRDQEALKKECKSKNLSRSEDEVKKKLVYKLLGNRGEKVIKRVTLRDQERLHKGEVLPEEVAARLELEQAEEESSEDEGVMDSTPPQSQQEEQEQPIPTGARRKEIKRPTSNKGHSKARTKSMGDVDLGQLISQYEPRRAAKHKAQSPTHASPPGKRENSGEMESSSEEELEN